MDELDVASLQDTLALADLRRWPLHRVPGSYGGWKNDTRQLRVTMRQGGGQAAPQVEIFYGSQEYAARYAIETGQRLDGNLDRKYDRAVGLWIARKQEHLLTIWHALQSGRNRHSFTAICAAPAEWGACRLVRAQHGRAGD